MVRRVFRVDVLPAQRGDCLWLTYGKPGDLRHVLVDGGPQETIPTLVPELERRLKALPGNEDRVELLVVTHIDADHIQGIVSLLSDPSRVRLFRDVWFNGYRHHVDEEFLGGPDAERLTAPLLASGRWNRAFDGGAVAVPDSGPLPRITLAGGLTLTLLGPTTAALRALAPKYEEACRRAGIAPGGGAPIKVRSWVRDEFLGFDPDVLAAARMTSDSSKPNRASITVVAEYDGRRALLLGDAHARPTLDALDRLGPGTHAFDVVKLAHHGSRNNTSRALLERIRCRKWIVSSDGAQFGHPDGECLSRVIVTQHRPTFYLNYVTDRVADLVDGAGDRWSVRLPRRRGGEYGTGIRVTV